MSPNLLNALRVAWSATDVTAKWSAIDALIPCYLGLHEEDTLLLGEAPPCARVGRPVRPVCIPPADLPKRRAVDREGRAALLHAIAHIEFNAINLALDAAWRFSSLGNRFVRNWLGVAIEDCVYVGDDQRDIDSARAAGMRSIVALWGYRRDDDDPATWGGDVLAESARELLDPALWAALR